MIRLIIIFHLIILSSFQHTDCQHHTQQCRSYQQINNEPVIIVGMRGSGKTTLAKNYAARNNHEFIDMDQLIFEQLNITSFKEYNQQHQNALQKFRQYESQMLHELIDQQINNPRLIISTGGGVVLETSNRELLKKMKNVVFLQYDDLKQSYLQSIQENNNRLDCNYEQYLSQFNERQSLYESVASHRFRIGEQKEQDDEYWNRIQQQFDGFVQKLR